MAVMTATRPRADELLLQLGTKVELGGSTGERQADDVLDAGRHGLEFFRLFGPPHARFTRTRHDFRRDFLRRYESEAGLVFGALRADQERFAEVGGGLADIAITLRNHGAAAFESWRGDAAGGVRARLGELIGAVGTLRERFVRLADLIGDVVDAADRAVYEKAVATGKLYADRIDGRTAGEVRFLVDFHGRARTEDVDDDEIFRAASLCGVRTRASLWRSRSTLLSEVASAVELWLRGTFVPAYDAKVAAFRDICTTAERKLAAGWQRLTDLLESLELPQPAPQPPAALPAAVPPAGTAPCADSSQPSAGQPSASQPGASQPTGGTPATSEYRPAREPLAPGGFAGAVAKAPSEPHRSTPPATSAPAAAGGGSMTSGLFGGMPMLGGFVSAEDHQRPATTLPLDGLTFAGVAHGAVIGAEDDTTEYNDAASEEAEASRQREERIPLADDDLW
jgi:hypothetical protein